MSEKAAIVRGVLRAWQRILSGYRPNLSIEITKECPLRCPGCYAYGDDHLGGTTTLRGLADYQGDELVGRFMRLIDDRQPLNVFIVGGEPLVRYRELTSILPQLDARDIHTEVVTSAVRPIPSEWLESAPAATCGLDRRAPGRARCATGASDIRPDSEAHCRASRHGSLHRHATAGSA